MSANNQPKLSKKNIAGSKPRVISSRKERRVLEGKTKLKGNIILKDSAMKRYS